jgi:hypothetical protein
MRKYLIDNALPPKRRLFGNVNPTCENTIFIGLLKQKSPKDISFLLLILVIN